MRDETERDTFVVLLLLLHSYTHTGCGRRALRSFDALDAFLTECCWMCVCVCACACVCACVHASICVYLHRRQFKPKRSERYELPCTEIASFLVLRDTPACAYDHGDHQTKRNALPARSYDIIGQPSRKASFVLAMCARFVADCSDETATGGGRSEGSRRAPPTHKGQAGRCHPSRPTRRAQRLRRRWMDEWMDGWMNGWMNGWMHALVDE